LKVMADDSKGNNCKTGGKSGLSPGSYWLSRVLELVFPFG